MKLTGAWIDDPRTGAVFDALAATGQPVYFVGGAIRNAVLGLPVGDLDLATPAHPETVTKAAERAGLKVVPTGISHGTVTIVVDALAHEVTTFRRDVSTDGRRATIAFTENIAEDAARRDFTMNALYADRDGVVIDPVGGLSDLQERRVRFVGDAHQRIREDYLRILRFFRFHAHFSQASNGFDADDIAVIASEAEGIDQLSRERVGQEMLRLLAAPDPSPALATMNATGVLPRVLQGATPEVVARLVLLEDTFGPDPIRRLAALGGENAAEALRLSKADSRRTALLRDRAGDMGTLGEIAWRDGEAFAWDVALLRAALTETPLPARAAEAIRAGRTAVFPVAAADLSDRFRGRELGDVLRRLEERWIASGFSLGKEELIQNLS